MGGIQPEHERSAGPVRANPAAQVGAARQRTDHRWRTRRRWVGGVNAVGRGGDPGVPGVRQGGGTGDPGSGERWRQRGTMGAPRQEGAQDPAGQGAAPVTRQAREEGLDLLLQQPFRGRAGHSILRVSRSFHDHDTDGSARAFGGTETVDNLPANPPPFNPSWEKGAGGMRGKRRGNAANHIIMRAGVASIASSWLSSPPVAPDAGWKPAHPAEGLRSLAMSSRSPVAPHAGRRPAHPGNSGRMLQE
jgi:hypothetical protein